MTPDTKNLTPDPRYVTHGWKVDILSKCQPSCSYGLAVMMFLMFGGKGSVNDKGVCRTASATSGLVKSKQILHILEFYIL